MIRMRWIFAIARNTVKLSLVTVCFNSEKHLRRCLDSVKRQLLTIHEHIIIDGESTDNSLAILKKYAKEDDGYVKRVVSEPDEGIYDAMNKGLSMADGDYVWFLNSDDMLADVNVTIDIHRALSQKHPAMYAGTTRIKSAKKIARMYRPSALNSFYVPQQPHPSLLTAVDFLRTHGIEFDSKKVIASDYKMQLEVVKAGGEIIIEDRILTDMYLGGVSNSSLRYKILGFRESISVYNEVFGKGGTRNAVCKTLSKVFQFIDN